MPHFMIALRPCINLLNLSWMIKCLFLRNMESLKFVFWKRKTINLLSSAVMEVQIFFHSFVSGK